MRRVFFCCGKPCPVTEWSPVLPQCRLRLPGGMCAKKKTSGEKTGGMMESAEMGADYASNPDAAVCWFSVPVRLESAKPEALPSQVEATATVSTGMGSYGRTLQIAGY